MPRVGGSNPGLSLAFMSRKKNRAKCRPTRRERGAAQEWRGEEEEPAGESGMDTRNGFGEQNITCSRLIITCNM